MLLDKIKVIHEKSRKVYGTVKVTKILNKESSEVINHKRVERIMRDNGLKSKVARKFKATTNSNHSFQWRKTNLIMILLQIDLTRKWQVIATISAILGHANTDTTDVYITTDETRLKECVLPMVGISVVRGIIMYELD